MSDELVFYGNPRSRAQMVHFMLEELGIPYRMVALDFEKGESRQADYLAINPMGKVPQKPCFLARPSKSGRGS